MTVTTTTSRIEYSGNGVTTAFSVPFYFLANGDLIVYHGTALQTLTTHYTVTGAGVLAGGSITFITAPTSSVVIYRDPAITQGVDYIANDSFPAESHEQALDRLTMITQRLKSMLLRALRLADSDVSGYGLQVPTPQAGYFLQWKADLTGFQNVIQVPASSYTVSSFMQTMLDDSGIAGVAATLGSSVMGTVSPSSFVTSNATGEIIFPASLIAHYITFIHSTYIMHLHMDTNGKTGIYDSTNGNWAQYYDPVTQQSSFDRLINANAGLSISGVTVNSANLNHRGALVYKNATQNIPNITETAVTFDLEAYDTSAIHSTSVNTNYLTVPAGVTKVRVMAAITFPANVTGFRSLRIRKNSSSVGGIPTMYVIGDAVITGTLNITSLPLIVVAGDNFELMVSQNSGASMALQNGDFGTVFGMEIVE